MSLNIVSFNVNGLRARLKNGFFDYKKYDIICLQEIKIKEGGEKDIKFDNYDTYWSLNKSTSFHGVAVLTKIKPLDVKYGIGDQIGDNEGRCITLFFKDFVLINCYVPNSGQELKRLDYRTGVWDVKFRRYIRSFNLPTVLCGDLNTCFQDIDIHNPKNKRKLAGFTDAERKNFDLLLNDEKDCKDPKIFIDSFRYKYPDKISYTFFSNKYKHLKCRERQIGWLLDRFLVSEKIKDKVIDVKHLTDIGDSDHIPILLEIDLS